MARIRGAGDDALEAKLRSAEIGTWLTPEEVDEIAARVLGAGVPEHLVVREIARQAATRRVAAITVWSARQPPRRRRLGQVAADLERFGVSAPATTPTRPPAATPGKIVNGYRVRDLERNPLDYFERCLLLGEPD